MRTIIRSIFVAICFMTGIQAFGQVTLSAGYLNVKETTSSGLTRADVFENGFYVGPTFHTNIAGDLSLNTGLYYSFQMAAEPFSIIVDDTTVNTTANLKEHYFLVPFTANYSLVFNENFIPFIYCGPTLQYGINSKTVYNADSGVEVLTYDNYAQDGTRNRLNLLVGGGLGFELYERVIFKAGYHVSLLNYYRGNDYKISRNYLQAGIALVF